MVPQLAAAAPWSKQVDAHEGIWETRLLTLEEEAAAARPTKVARVIVLNCILTYVLRRSGSKR